MQYEAVIGFEAHCELATRTKVFCGCLNEFGAPPNTNVCPVCLGLPGALPVVNRKAVEYAVMASMALNCDITERATFDRKNYYYPDLPKNYQISEQYHIIGVGGHFEFPVGGALKRVRINNVHLEEDAGKNVHPETPGADYSLVDLNRAGAPLLEIVTEPDLCGKEDSAAFMDSLRNLLLYTGVSEAQMQKGQLRFELNISVRPVGETALGKKVEIKNLNSMRSALRCIDHEFERQCDIVDGGGTVVSQTRLWDEATFETRSMRDKEGASDYRYFPDPDLVTMHLTPEWQGEIRARIPELQHAKRERFVKAFGLTEYDASALTVSKAVADYYEAAVARHDSPKAIANWVINEVLRVVKESDEDEGDPHDLKIGPAQLGELVELIDAGTISGKIAKQVFAKMLETGGSPKAIVETEGLAQISDTGAIEALVDEQLANPANASAIEDFKNGKKKALGRVVGQIMKASQGKANPQVVNELLARKIGE